MSDQFRFTPASIEAFKRAARDLQRAYPLGLQQAQEVLAKAYGYLDLHALQEHLKTNPAPGPYPSEMDFGDAALLRLAVHGRFLKLAPFLQSGRISLDDLYLVDDPETRKAAMDYQALVDSYVDSRARAERTIATSEYVVFEDRRPDKASALFALGPQRREGVFLLTTRGRAVFEAMEWLTQMTESTEPGSKERSRAIRAYDNLLDRYPNHPYPLAQSIWTSASYASDEDDGARISRGLAKELWPNFQKCRSSFDALMPNNFSGEIEPRLCGRGVANKHYIAILYWGAVVAASIGLKRDALSWARRSLKFHPADSYGAALLLDELRR